MKKVFTAILVAGLCSFYACGPNAEETAAMEQARQDSVNMVEEQARIEADNARMEAEQAAAEAGDDATDVTEESTETPVNQ